MKLLILDNYEEMSRRAARIIASQITLVPRSVLGLATGGTVLGTYRRLSELYREEQLDFSALTVFNLDEYYPIASENPHSYAAFMRKHLFSRVNLRPEAAFIPNGQAADIEAECRRYDRMIRDAGGIDLQLLGIGRNGHIGFNEPDLTFEAGTHQVVLDEQTLQDNSRFFSGDEAVPRQAVSMGIKTIMHARKIVLLASGVEKRDAVHRMLFGKITPALPASVLQLHPDVTLVLDREAASDAVAEQALAERGVEEVCHV